jgi:hypothetical protein
MDRVTANILTQQVLLASANARFVQALVSRSMQQFMIQCGTHFKVNHFTADIPALLDKRIDKRHLGRWLEDR